MHTPRMLPGSRHRFAAELRWLGVDIEHLLQKDSVLELNLGGPVLLKLPSLDFVPQMWEILRSIVISYRTGSTESINVLGVTTALDTLSDEAVAR